MQDSDPVIVSLHEEVAETIMRREELVLSETDEVGLFSLPQATTLSIVLHDTGMAASSGQLAPRIYEQRTDDLRSTASFPE